MSKNSIESRTFNQSDYTVRFNPPAMEYADTRYVPGQDIMGSPKNPDRARDVNGANSLILQQRSDILSRKGWFAPDTTYTADWSDSEDDEVEGDGSTYESLGDRVWPDDVYINPFMPWTAPRTVVDVARFAASVTSEAVRSRTSQPSTEEPRITPDTLFDNGVKYGFRFMYNPVTLSFQTGVTANVNVSYIMAGKSTAVPSGVASTGASIGVNFPISRVHDMAILRGGIAGWFNPNQLSQYDVQRYRDMYKSSVSVPNIPRGFGQFSADVTEEDLFGIASRGTMYDLEFMFRAFLGRQWKTYYRNYTADIGIAFSAPLVLYLSPTMIYRVRLGSLGFTHRVFTPDMVPTYTEVSLGFERIPDVIDFA